jgi:hypothetical protein
LYKTATIGRCDIPQPWFYEVEAKAKYEAWKKFEYLGEEGARLKYVEIASNLLKQGESAESAPAQGWVNVSQLERPEQLPGDVSIFSCAQNGDLDGLEVLKTRGVDLESKDENVGRLLIHRE